MLQAAGALQVMPIIEGQRIVSSYCFATIYAPNIYASKSLSKVHITTPSSYPYQEMSVCYWSSRSYSIYCRFSICLNFVEVVWLHLESFDIHVNCWICASGTYFIFLKFSQPNWYIQYAATICYEPLAAYAFRRTIIKSMCKKATLSSAKAAKHLVAIVRPIYMSQTRGSQGNDISLLHARETQ
jgi:hypothetical protein